MVVVRSRMCVKDQGSQECRGFQAVDVGDVNRSSGRGGEREGDESRSVTSLDFCLYRMESDSIAITVAQFTIRQSEKGVTISRREPGKTQIALCSPVSSSRLVAVRESTVACSLLGPTRGDVSPQLGPERDL